MGRAPGMSPPLRLCLLGTFTVEGEPVGQVPVGKARRVLAVLAQRRGEFVTIEHLVDALWEDHPPDRADRNVAALISRLRRALGRELIEGSAAGYRIRADRVTVDLHDAADLVATAELELGQRRYALASTSGELAAKLLDADTPMAGEHEDRWVRELRSAAGDLLHRARTAWAAAAVELGAFDTAVQVAGAVLHADPFDEGACRTVMLAHQRAGRPGSALLAYRSLARALVEELGIDPSPATRDQYLAVLRAESTRRRSRRSHADPRPCRSRRPRRGAEPPPRAVVDRRCGHPHAGGRHRRGRDRQERAGRRAGRGDPPGRHARRRGDLLRGRAVAVPAAARRPRPRHRPADRIRRGARAGGQPAGHPRRAGARAPRSGRAGPLRAGGARGRAPAQRRRRQQADRPARCQGTGAARRRGHAARRAVHGGGAARARRALAGQPRTVGADRAHRRDSGGRGTAARPRRVDPAGAAHARGRRDAGRTVRSRPRPGTGVVLDGRLAAVPLRAAAAAHRPGRSRRAADRACDAARRRRGADRAGRRRGRAPALPVRGPRHHRRARRRGRALRAGRRGLRGAGRAGGARRAAHRPGRQLPVRQRHRPPGGLRVGVRTGPDQPAPARGPAAARPARSGGPSTWPPPATSAGRRGPGSPPPTRPIARSPTPTPSGCSTAPSPRPAAAPTPRS